MHIKDLVIKWSCCIQFTIILLRETFEIKFIRTLLFQPLPIFYPSIFFHLLTKQTLELPLIPLLLSIAYKKNLQLKQIVEQIMSLHLIFFIIIILME